ncbi:peptidyl-prolyl cis-trans isomerase [candidate division KSB1 bacterium]|nr:peptidyl-prolyl cis-trans isomerase [candidate division KSB1 bacterium]
MKKIFLLHYLIIGLALIFSCTSQKKSAIPEGEIVARVGDTIITVNEFKYNFEFSPSPAKLDYEPRKTFLNYLIKEKLISTEGYRKGYHRHIAVQRAVKNRRYSNLLQAFYKKYIHDQIKIPEQDLRDAIQKSTITWRLRIWPTRTREEAELALKLARRVGLSEFIKQELKKSDVPVDNQLYFVSDPVDFLDIRPEILTGIQDIKIGEISEPIPFGDGYALFEPLDIKREGIKSDELNYGTRRKKIEARLHDIQADKIIHTLMDSILTPLEIRVSSKRVDMIAPLLFKWISDTLPNGSLIAALQKSNSNKSYFLELKKQLEEPLVIFSTGTKTVQNYIEYMDYFRQNLIRQTNYEDFRNALIMEIGRMMRNDTFVQIAEKDGYGDSSVIVTDIKRWEAKWTYDVYRADLVKGIVPTDDELKSYFSKHWREMDIVPQDSARFESYYNQVYNEVIHQKHLARLEKELETIRQQYPVWINEELLNKLELTGDNKNSRNISFFVRRRFDRQAAIPTVDLKWLYY